MHIFVAGLTKRYRGRTVLDGVTFAAGPGVTGLLGPNGAGKTTLLRILATVLAPDGGRVRLGGRDPATPSGRLEVRRRLGYLPQEPGFHRSLTVFEFVDYIAILKEMTDRRARHDEVRRVIELVGLDRERSMKISRLSGGMRRRTGLAQALLGNPDVVILDEPTAGLDPEQRMRFRDLISRVGEDCAVLLSTHQTEDVAALCHRVVALVGGRTLFDGTPEDLTGLAGGRIWHSDRRSPGATLSWRTGDGRYRNIGTPPPDAELLEPSIEDAYLLLTGDTEATSVGSAA